MKKIIVSLSYVIAVLIMVMVIYMAGEKERERQLRLDEDFRRIEYYTKDYFVDHNSIETSEYVKAEMDANGENIALSVTFAYDPPNYPVQEEVYKQAAEYALRVVSFFPNVTSFDFTVLWLTYGPSAQEVLHVAMDEKSVGNLKSVYYDALRDENAGFDMNYRKAFSEFDESEEFKTWRNQPITDSDSPVS
ncbi:MAG: hypothetical protein NC251_06345 [Lachnoclostridium sp.]|nr:hypothetical protein [Lachnospira sp.]MCM1248034.1 hypothetical protein [Lachnoclostridium sp.]MCM1535851.1 hypothetical protein [Clostridium sp.]